MTQDGAASNEPSAGRDGLKQWGVYLLVCNDASLYAGATNDLVARVRRHQAGVGSRYTRSRLPVEVVYWEPCEDRSAALKREAAIKRLNRAAKLALIAIGEAPARAPGAL